MSHNFLLNLFSNLLLSKHRVSVDKHPDSCVPLLNFKLLVRCECFLTCLTNQLNDIRMVEVLHVSCFL